MRSVLHLSDLHFGRVDRSSLKPLLRAAWEIGPDLVAVSGDLTQRARRSEFREARSFLSSLPLPQIVVPGNHDIPLYNPVLRFLMPLKRYKRFISGDIAPMYVDEEVAALGVNTTRSLVAKGGRINITQVESICRHFSRLERGQTRIIVTHHPFDLPEGYSTVNLVGRSRMAMEKFARCGIDLFLSGHLHITHTGNTARYMIPGFSALVVQAGTVTSTRGRGELNSFNLIRIDPPGIEVETHTWRPGALAFARSRSSHFMKTEKGWVPADSI
ncbi:MAG: metallophosphoesterase [Bacteriovoracaceae bacterium]|jgi:3',5'-cyclic AMP phosphodiesterase CpdA|nr:metallophosphoesterase [Bacteriovoracaceae bacterium]HOE73260.1 metallophosphoesterase family protein [Deltaproteobacteria bacterium]HRR21807.1 metallophosphoesterase family protein [Desulfomonilia bacterium]HPL86223.1 metallophosphoesterase family protein [Deltaproteobacteria bacterium]HRR69714.1 metallophosphoesterase family protein [Desulfomonilia bacterium]